MEIVGYKGSIIFDSSKPDGTPRKLLDVSKIAELGWKAGIDLRSGLKTVYKNFIDNYEQSNAFNQKSA